MVKHIIEGIIETLRKIKFDDNLSKYKEQLLIDLKLEERIIFGNQFFVVFELQTRKFIFIHRNIKEILGIEGESITLTKLNSLIYSEDSKQVLNAAKIILHDGLFNHENKPLDDVYCIEFRFNKSENEIIWLQTEILTLIKDKTGVPLLALIQFTEINENTEHKEFKMYYCGRNAKNIHFPTGRSVIYKKGHYLTEREKQILLLIIDGKTNIKIAQILKIALRTVDTHRTNILLKTGQHNTAGLIEWAKSNL